MKLFCDILKNPLAAGEKNHGLGKVSQSTWKAWTLSRVSSGMPEDLQGKSRAEFRLDARRPEAVSESQPGKVAISRIPACRQSSKSQKQVRGQ